MNETKRCYFLCIKNRGDAASLQVWTVYQALSDPEAEAHGMLRIIDEFGEDYLFPVGLFVPIEISEAAEPATGAARPAQARQADAGTR